MQVALADGWSCRAGSQARGLATTDEPWPAVRSWWVSDGPSSGQFEIRLGRLPWQQVPDAINRA
jgi:hypothetical protein